MSSKREKGQGNMPFPDVINAKRVSIMAIANEDIMVVQIFDSDKVNAQPVLHLQMTYTQAMSFAEGLAGAYAIRLEYLQWEAEQIKREGLQA